MPGVEEPSAHEGATVPFSTKSPPEQLTDKPVLGMTVGTNLTVPAKLFLLARVTWVKLAVTPELILVEGTIEMVKSPT